MAMREKRYPSLSEKLRAERAEQRADRMERYAVDNLGGCCHDYDCDCGD